MEHKHSGRMRQVRGVEFFRRQCGYHGTRAIDCEECGAVVVEVQVGDAVERTVFEVDANAPVVLMFDGVLRRGECRHGV
jgi:hypothetical protein